MDLRKYERIQAKFAKTSRLKNTSIPYMQRILNSENLEFEKQEITRFDPHLQWKSQINFGSKTIFANILYPKKKFWA